MLNIQILGDKELMARIDAMPGAVRAALLKKVTGLTLKLEGRITNEKLSGQVLHARTGRLRRSISSRVEETPIAVYGKAVSSGDVKYGAIHEFGGQTKPHVIEAKGKALAFMMGGKMRFAKKVNHPGSKMPTRSYMRSSLKDMQVEIIDGLKDAVREGLTRK